MNTISHAQTHVTQRLPIRERLLHRTVAIIVDRKGIVLEEVANKELGPALCLQEKTQAETVEDAPSRCVSEMQRQSRAMRHDWKTGSDHYVEYQQHQHRIRRPNA